MSHIQHESSVRWALLWRSDNWLDGRREHLVYDERVPVLFRTRQEARDWRDERYGYIRERPDLRREPHGWRLPLPVKVRVVLEPDQPT